MLNEQTSCRVYLVCADKKENYIQSLYLCKTKVSLHGAKNGERKCHPEGRFPQGTNGLFGLASWAHLLSSPGLLQKRKGPDQKGGNFGPAFPLGVIQDHHSSCLNSWSERPRSAPPRKQLSTSKQLLPALECFEVECEHAPKSSFLGYLFTLLE